MINKYKRFIKVYIIVLFDILMLFIGTRYFGDKILLGNRSNIEVYQSYNKHYVMISDNINSDFWQTLYKEAQIEAQRYNAYLECMGKNLAVDYSTPQLLAMAISSGVDGIILEANESQKVTELINEAIKKQIPVITVFKDNPKSRRQAFIGINSYRLGEIYGEEIIELYKNTPIEIVILMPLEEEEREENLIYTSIKDTLKRNDNEMEFLDIKTIAINSEDTFGVEESIRNFILNTRDLPDIMVCLNEKYTKCVYQAIVDYNRVGEMNILGYSNSEKILEAIQKEIIYASLYISPKLVGELCIQQLEEYEQVGYVSEYTIINASLVTKESVEQYLSTESTYE